ncbi:MAG: response regulator [Spirochaetes bacterium]|nr:response regulator [Spirochaetota bacterium]MBU0955818.1 response regulator [Spirochaetota bacterium]
MDEKKRILIVDDEQINLEFFEVMLSKLGFDIHLAENGREALEAVRKLNPDLIILDNIMPKLTGWEVTKILKNDPEYSSFADIPIIMFSALDDVRDKVEGLELGADDYITKPFNFTEVLARIRVVLRTHDLIKQIENREKRIAMAETVLETVTATSTAARKLIDKLNEQANDPAAIQASAKALAEIVDSMDTKVQSLRKEAEGLSELATDLKAIRRKVRVELSHPK